MNAHLEGKKEKKIENGSKHDIKSSLTEMHHYSINFFQRTNNFHAWTLDNYILLRTLNFFYIHVKLFALKKR